MIKADTIFHPCQGVMVNLSHNCDHKHAFFHRLLISVWRIMLVIGLATSARPVAITLN